MTSEAKEKSFDVHNLESVYRITHLPLVESGWSIAGNAYNRIKKSNNLLYWTLSQAESSIQGAIDTALPAVIIFETPISTLDKVVCKSLDIVEEKIPAIGMPPEMIYWNTKQYVSEIGSNMVRPILKRADSVKELGNNVLSSKYTTFAADTLDNALNVADKYIDKYLPADVYDDDRNNENAEKEDNVDGPAGKAIHTIHHVGKFSGKLQRRLTKRTLIEAKALKEQSAEAIHVLIYVAELIATDPKLAFTKGKELWKNLSQDEPENQESPENLDQLLVLVIRESARRVVHLVNYTKDALSHVPSHVNVRISKLLQLLDSVLKSVDLEEMQQGVVTSLKNQAHQFTLYLKQLNNYVKDLLDNISDSLSSEQNSHQPTSNLEVPTIRVQLRAVNRVKKTSNGVDSNSN